MELKNINQLNNSVYDYTNYFYKIYQNKKNNGLG